MQFMSLYIADLASRNPKMNGVLCHECNLTSESWILIELHSHQSAQWVFKFIDGMLTFMAFIMDVNTEVN